jgi:hypothetical protein
MVSGIRPFQEAAAAMSNHDFYPVSYDHEGKKYRSITLVAWVRIMKTEGGRHLTEIRPALQSR